MLSIQDIMNYFSNEINIHDLRNKIKKNYKNYCYDLMCDMPNIITSKNFKQFELLLDEPNFVGEKIVNSKIIKISKLEDNKVLKNKLF